MIVREKKALRRLYWDFDFSISSQTIKISVDELVIWLTIVKERETEKERIRESGRARETQNG